MQVFEHEKLMYSKTGPFMEHHWKALARYAEKSKEAYYTVLPKGIKFSCFVGVIQAGDLTVEVLPKADMIKSASSNCSNINDEKNLWQKVLVSMLKECRMLKAESSNKASLKLNQNSLLDIYLFLFLEETERLLHDGLIKRYRKEDKNQLALKGQLLFAKNISKNIVHKERFYVRHSVYNFDNTYNQIIYKALKLCPLLSNNSIIKEKVNRLLFSFPELSDIKVNESTFETIFYDRKTERYREALAIAKLILLRYQPDISGGNDHVTAILFDMNKLWEEFVFRRLKKEELKYNIKVLPQNSKPFWKPDLNGFTKNVRPDMVLHYKIIDTDIHKVLILDTKWKKLINSTPSDDDLKQMFVYNLLWKCDNSILLYPSAIQNSSNGCYQYISFQMPSNNCSVATISILNNKNELNRSFGQEVLKLVLNEDFDALEKKAILF